MSKQKKILLVDDERSVITYLEHVLRRLGHTVESAQSGNEALNCVTSREFDLVISDLNMPGEPNGLDLIRKFREIRGQCPIVVISGFPTQDRLDSCEEIGVKTFLTKPFELSFIRQVLDEVFSGAAGDAPAKSEGQASS